MDGLPVLCMVLAGATAVLHARERQRERKRERAEDAVPFFEEIDEGAITRALCDVGVFQIRVPPRSARLRPPRAGPRMLGASVAALHRRIATSSK